MNDHPKIPAQSQDSMPADEYKMDPKPDYAPRHPGVGKLAGKVAFITGGDSGIGRAVSVLFAREGAKVAIAYLEEDEDAQETKRIVEEEEGSEALLIRGDLGAKDHAEAAVKQAVEHFGQLDILINNAAQQWVDEDIANLSEERLRRVMDSNVMSYFFCTQAALPHLKEGASIINTTSVNAFKGNDSLIAYSTSRGASLALARSLALNLADRGIRVNAVAPGPVWTPFIPGSIPAESVEGFGSHTTIGRPAQPWEVATSYLFLASSDGECFTGQTLHPNAGYVVGA
ncbi:SDR family oxidoreductase [Amaricoccus macauensis]|uniref:SDR family oxidoreductase n=1 Tax=Amaricoccus macauensis TaxID=57001 RepID=UPI003C7E90AD